MRRPIEPLRPRLAAPPRPPWSLPELGLTGRLGGRALVSWEWLSGGATHAHARLDLSDGERWVLRLVTRGSAAEQAGLQRLGGRWAPVPEVLEVGEGWWLMRFVEGAPPTPGDAALPALGHALAQLQRCRFERGGRLGADGQVQPWSFGGLAGFVAATLEDPRVASRLGPLGEALTTWALREANFLAELDAEPAVLTHGDMNPSNLLVRGGELMAILDWDYAHAGSPWMDLGNLLRSLGEASAPAIEAGLRAGGARLPGDWVRRAYAVDLSSQLEFLTRELDAAFIEACRGRIAQTLRAEGLEI